jgi:hypothetical protein
MGNVYMKKPPLYVKRHADYRNKRLGGKTGPASGVRRIDPETGEVIETISKTALKKRRKAHG